MRINEVRSILKTYNIRPSKRLGQNFLVDRNVLERIISALNISKDDTVLEIGPGLGALTSKLCRLAKSVIAIEKDRRLYDFLTRANTERNLRLCLGDILEYRFGAEENLKVVGNLPYYISSPILVHLLNNRRFIDELYITVQKEFGERLVAAPGMRAYGSITCLVKFFAEPTRLFTIKRAAFYPAPEVDSSFFKIKFMKNGLFLTDEEKMFKIIRASFAKRRKTILNSLYGASAFGPKEEVAAWLKKAGISPERRPETLSVEEFALLAK